MPEFRYDNDARYNVIYGFIIVILYGGPPHVHLHAPRPGAQPRPSEAYTRRRIKQQENSNFGFGGIKRPI